MVSFLSDLTMSVVLYRLYRIQWDREMVMDDEYEWIWKEVDAYGTSEDSLLEFVRKDWEWRQKSVRTAGASTEIQPQYSRTELRGYTIEFHVQKGYRESLMQWWNDRDDVERSSKNHGRQATG
jgi:hypothetical protein